MKKDFFAVCLEHVDLKRGNVPVFQNFSWNLTRGEHCFVMGNNGCGKTSLLELIMGYVWPQKGIVRVLGEQLGQVFLPELRTRIGYVSPWIFKRMGGSVEVLKVVASGVDGSVGYWGNVSNELQKRVMEKLEFFHCADIARREFGTLSSGQQFKVMLARALINDPDLFLLDEPFSQLDIGARMQAYDLIEKWTDLGHSPSLVLVTHHLEDITRSYQNGLLLGSGRIYSGKKDSILKNEIFSEVFDVRKKIF